MLEQWASPVPFDAGMFYGRVFNTIIQMRAFDASAKVCDALPSVTPLQVNGSANYIAGFIE